MMKKLFIFIFALVGLFLASSLFAKDPASNRSVTFNKPGQDKFVQTLSNIANWSYWVRHDGWSGRHPVTGNSGGTYPRNTSTIIFQDGFVWGGIIPDDVQLRSTDPDPTQRLRVGGQTYRVGTSPGRIVTPGTATSDPVGADAEAPEVRIYRIRSDWESLFPTDDAGNRIPNPVIGDFSASVINDAAEQNDVAIGNVTAAMAQAVVDQYEQDWNEWPADLGAPVYPDGTPGLAGADQVIWFVCNDLDDQAATTLYGSHTIGMELQVTMWAYNQPGTTLGQIMFKRYRLINKSGYRVERMYLAQWSDPDVGEYTDDLVGSDVDRSLGFAYSGFQNDVLYADFNLPPGSIGYDFFQGPLLKGVAGEDRNNNGIDDADDWAIFDLDSVGGPGNGYINLPMTSFGYFAAGSQIDDPELGDYNGTLEWFNLLQGFTTTTDTSVGGRTPFFAGFGPDAGQPTFFPASGDPVKITGDLDGFGSNLPPGDRRMSLSSGPFTMEPWVDQNGNSLPDFGEPGIQEVVVAIVGGIIPQEGGNNRNAVAQLKVNDDFAQFIYGRLFSAIPRPPAAPSVRVTALEDAVYLEWGGTQVDEVEKDLDLGYKFEGYNIYQLPSPSATKAQATRIATFDRDDNAILTLTGPRFVPEFGEVLTVPIQFGTNNGLRRHFEIPRDFINGLPLYPGNRYYFAVTAYNAKDEDGDGVVDTDVAEQGLESALNVFEVIPQPTVPGTRYPDRPGTQLEIVKNSTSTGGVAVTVVNPRALTGSDYRVEFNEEPHWILEPDTSKPTGFDTLGSWHSWNLVNTTTGDMLVEDNENLSGDLNYPIRQGILVQVLGPKELGLAGWESAGDRWITGVNWGGQEFFNGMDIGAKFFGSTLGLSDLAPVLLEFQDQASVDANGYASKGAVYRRDLGYGYDGIGELPITAWDVVDPDNPRRLNICFVEDEDESAANGSAANKIWDMGWNASTGAYPENELGGREYLFFMKSDYNEGADYDDTNFGPESDVLYAIWATQRGTREYLRAEFTMDILANIPNSPSDSYTFSTRTIVQENAELAKDDVEQINVFPNPYYADNPEETSRFDRFVTFTHLPEKVTIRIFTISGVQVRKLTEEDKADPKSQFLQWDLLNETDLPVASGIYIAHIEMPAPVNKEKVLKLFIVQGAEILEFF